MPLTAPHGRPRDQPGKPLNCAYLTGTAPTRSRSRFPRFVYRHLRNAPASCTNHKVQVNSEIMLWSGA